MSRSALPPAVLLDTCAVIWLANGDPMTTSATVAILHAGLADGVFVSPVSAWEVGLLSRPKVPIVTRDRRIIDYARDGHAQTIPC